MKIFAIGDTHLSGNPPTKPMDIFNSSWINHWDKIKTDWQEKVSYYDYVLLAGDISWAMKLEQALPDLNEIINLPGKKVMIRGNHDYWWQTITKMQKATNNQITFLQNNFTRIGEIALCGSRGWISPGDPLFSGDDLTIYKRELNRVKTSLDAATKAGFSRIILMLHFPPAYDSNIKTGFIELIDNYNVEICVYGHLHGEAAKKAVTGKINGTTYCLVACDALNFKLKQLL